MRKRILSLLLCAAFLFGGVARASSSTDALLEAVDALARHGWILNCAYRVKSDNIDDMKEDYGRPDTDNYSKSGKGTFAEYNELKVVAGYNNGGTIFELRSFDGRLYRIHYDDVKSYFGAPDHVQSSNGEKYVSYVLNEDVNLKFIFGKGENPALKHYNVIWLQGTENSRADDPGRDW